MKIRIMAVDDEPTVLDPLKIMLEAHGYEVLAIEHSRGALKQVAHRCAYFAFLRGFSSGIRIARIHSQWFADCGHFLSAHPKSSTRPI
jgi:CheY-like chemotaxis protein